MWERRYENAFPASAKTAERGEGARAGEGRAGVRYAQPNFRERKYRRVLRIMNAMAV
jgi:hypothetical protein